MRVDCTDLLVDPECLQDPVHLRREPQPSMAAVYLNHVQEHRDMLPTLDEVRGQGQECAVVGCRPAVNSAVDLTVCTLENGKCQSFARQPRCELTCSFVAMWPRALRKTRRTSRPRVFEDVMRYSGRLVFIKDRYPRSSMIFSGRKLSQTQRTVSALIVVVSTDDSCPYR